MPRKTFMFRFVGLFYTTSYSHSVSFPHWDIIAFISWKITVSWKQNKTKHNIFLLYLIPFKIWQVSYFAYDTLSGMKVYITPFWKCFIGTRPLPFFSKDESKYAASQLSIYGSHLGNEGGLLICTVWKLSNARYWWEQTIELHKAYVVI